LAIELRLPRPETAYKSGRAITAIIILPAKDENAHQHKLAPELRITARIQRAVFTSFFSRTSFIIL
jgi:hypothetical protein